ncbi:unnamed protein product, partial [Effrenium voratum]
MVFLNFTAPLPAGAAVGLRLSPFALPSSYADVHPGSSEPLVQPMSLNIRLESVPEGTDTVDACHPAVWACGLYPFGGLVLRPSKSRFASFQVEVSGTWAMLRFAVNATLQFLGNPQDVLKISPPYGYSVLAVYGSSLQALRRREASGQLNRQEVVDLPSAIETSRGSFLVELDGMSSSAKAVQVTNLYGTVMAQQEHYVNLSLMLPESGVEPSLFDPTDRSPNRSACANAWGISLEAAGEPAATAFARGNLLAPVDQLLVECATRATEANSSLSVRFRVTPAVTALPAGSLLMALRISDLDLREPALADAAPFLRSTSSGAELEARHFPKFGCPPMSLYSSRRLRQDLTDCAVFFNDLQGATEILFNASGVKASAVNEVFVRVRNTPWTNRWPNVTLAVYRSRHPFRLIPAPLVLAESTG